MTKVWRQSDNVPFEQSGNPLDNFSLEERNKDDVEESQEETDHTTDSSRGAGIKHSAGEAATVCAKNVAARQWSTGCAGSRPVARSTPASNSKL
jgi:hypothetical protein